MTGGSRLGLAGVVALALGVRLYGIAWGLPDFYEEAYPYRIAWGMWSWGNPAGFRLDPHFFKYPSLTIYVHFLGQGLLYALMRATGAVAGNLDFRVLQALDPTALVVAARTITALFGAATTIPVFFMGLRAGRRCAAFVAALLVALCPVLIAKSQMVEVDVPLTFFVAASLWAALALLEAPTLRRTLVAGTLVGLATSAKYPGLLTLAPCGVALLLARRPDTQVAPRPTREPRRSSRDRRGRGELPRRARRAAFSPMLLAAALVAAAAAAFLLTSPYVLIDFRGFLADFLAERQHMQLGHFGSEAGAAWLQYAGDWFRTVCGWTFGAMALAGLIYFPLRRERWALVLGSFLVIFFAIVGSWAMKADRYLLPLVPAGAVFAAVLVARLASRLPQPVAIPALVALAGVLVAPFVPMARPNSERLHTDPRTEARAWILAHVAPGSLVASEEYGPSLKGPMWLRTLEPDLQAAVLARKTPMYATLEVPFFQVSPERSAPLYDPSLYEGVDLLVVTGAVRDRYRADPARFPAQCAFYDAIEKSFAERARFVPKGSTGSTLTIFANPRATTPFARRPEAPQALPARSSGRNAAVGFLHFNQGVNEESFGFLERAVEHYRLALRQGDVSREDQALAVMRIGHCLLARGVEAAEAYLDTAIAAAPDSLEQMNLAAARAALRERPEAFRAGALPDLRAAGGKQ